ncbi:DUF6113 family protein [Rarobacter incanus]|uniref:Uncharacterized protein n=1 Tax=Rarobacter incanus TaxID=153494 RepID=A0A542SNC7_9MICO|nr:DUF6113 family protein [Rarobacter incanus]TQK76123.1 hypothetical protein FB389_0781 [Rarobacter incanus]
MTGSETHESSGASPRVRAVPAAAVGLLGGAALGVVVATLGTLVHRQWFPYLLVAALLATLLGATWMVTWRRGAALVGYAVGWSVAALVLAGTGPGGDVLVAGTDLGAAPVAAGVIWMNGGSICAFLPGVLLLKRFDRWTRARSAARPAIESDPVPYPGDDEVRAESQNDLEKEDAKK